MRHFTWLNLILIVVGVTAFLPGQPPELAPPGTVQLTQKIFFPEIDYLNRVAANGEFLETFDGNSPSTPQPWEPKNWDITVHSRNRDLLYSLTPMNAGHGPNCEPPPLTHLISGYEDAVYLCRNHMMTAINDDGYGVIYLTPDHMVDFTNQEAVIRFDMSTGRTSTRDWVDIWITPYSDHLQLPLAAFLPDLSGEPRNSIKVEMGVFNGNTTFSGQVVRDFKTEPLKVGGFLGYEEVFVPSFMQRETFELRISRTHLKFGMPKYDLWWIDTDISALNFTQGVVQFGHHSYNPTKDCSGCGPNTWHWDNFSIYPSVPFTIIGAEQRYANPAVPTVNFTTPSQVGSYLRFAAIGKQIEVSFDGGATWQTAETQAQLRYEEGAFWSYWTPIPPGITQVMFRGQSWWGGEWHARDISFWSPDVGAQAGAGATSSAGATPSASVVSPFDSPADLCSDTPIE